MTRVLFGLGLGVLLCLAACQDEERTSCVADDECFSAPELQSNERCAPRDIWCDHGQCRSNGCATVCKVTQSGVNPCPDASMICTESLTSNGLAFCTDHPIRCATADDCPLYRPSAGADAQWECENSFCRFPGYEFRNP